MLSPEAKELLATYTDHMKLAGSESERRLADRIDQMRSEVRQDISELRAKQDKQGEELVLHGKQLVKMETQMVEGEKRFVAQDSRIGRLENLERRSSLGLAKLAGAAGGGGIIGALIHRLWQ